MGHLLKIKCLDSRVNVRILASSSVPFTLTTVQVPNLALNSQETDNSEGVTASCSRRTKHPGEQGQ
jgi:hypothetical protein